MPNNSDSSALSNTPSTAPPATGGGFFSWMKASPGSPKVAEVNTAGPRSRRDSHSLSADEALNISRSNARPLDIPRTLPESNIEAGPSSPKDVPRSKPRYDKLGLIAAFSGGPGSF